MSPDQPEPVIGDDKDWTWTTERPCPDCGFDPGAVTGGGLGEALRATATRWRRALERPTVRSRPEPRVWSALEYACHVRDVHRLFTERVRMMLDQDDPVFAGWDQDAAAVDGRYGEQDPQAVVVELTAAGEAAAGQYDSVPPGSWDRTGRRGDGATFTVLSIGRYHLHEVLHHLHDVQG